MFIKSRQFCLWAWRQEGTPAQRARGLAVGVFSGCFPFFGFQTFFGIFLASVFRGNHLLAAAGTWISNPFTYVPLYWFNYKVGEVFLGQGRDSQSLAQLTRDQLWDKGLILSSRILLGSSIVGLLLGIVVGFSFYALHKSLTR
nr:DUF2062 domain-containing protein [Prochlorococcus marinus]